MISIDADLTLFTWDAVKAAAYSLLAEMQVEFFDDSGDLSRVRCELMPRHESSAATAAQRFRRALTHAQIERIAHRDLQPVRQLLTRAAFSIDTDGTEILQQLARTVTERQEARSAPSPMGYTIAETASGVTLCAAIGHAVPKEHVFRAISRVQDLGEAIVIGRDANGRCLLQAEFASRPSAAAWAKGFAEAMDIPETETTAVYPIIKLNACTDD